MSEKNFGSESEREVREQVERDAEAFATDLAEFIRDHKEQNLHAICLGMSEIFAMCVSRMPPSTTDQHLSYLFTALSSHHEAQTRDMLEKVATVMGVEGNA